MIKLFTLKFIKCLSKMTKRGISSKWVRGAALQMRGCVPMVRETWVCPAATTLDYDKTHSPCHYKKLDSESSTWIRSLWYTQWNIWHRQIDWHYDVLYEDLVCTVSICMADIWTVALALYINFVIFDDVQVHLNMDIING